MRFQKAIPSQSWLIPLGIPSTADKVAQQFGRPPMRDTEPFNTSRVQVKMLALPVQPAVLNPLQLVTRGQMRAIWRQHRRIRCGKRQRTSFPRTRDKAAQSYLPTVRWRSRRDQCGWQTRSQLPKLLDTRSGISSQSLHTPIGAGFVLVKQRVTTQAGKHPARKVMPSFSLTHGGAPKLSLEASSGSVAQPATQAPLIVVFVRPVASSFFLGEGAGKTRQHGRRDANGELPTRIRGGVAVEVACPSG